MQTHKEKTIFIGFVVICTLMCMVSATFAAVPNVQYRFKFNPPSGTSYITTCISTKSIDNGAAGKRVDVSTSKEQIQINKTDRGYSFAPKTLSVEMTRNGEKLPASQEVSIQALARVPLVCNLDANGRLISIDNVEALKQAIDTMLKEQNPGSANISAEIVEAMKASITNNITLDWNNRIVGFVGKTVNSGDVWVSRQEIGSTFGDISVAMKTYFGNPVIVDNHNCMKIGFAYSGDKNSTKQLMSRIMDTIAKSTPAGYPMPKVISATLSGKGHRIVDPSTMLVYSEEVSRTMKMRLSIPGTGDVITTFNQSRVYTYDYAK
ncbi:MAG: hypothetical protein ACYC0V_14915 [Armatimonadota bacterium]